KICNVCHCLKPTENFAKNQNNLHGTVRRPSCQKCRTSIDKRAPKTKQAKQMEKQKPKKGELFTCPICRKRSIVGITAKIVADHDHHTGNIRAFICDSCNTGLGRFKNGENYLMNAVNYINDHDVLG
ncbi:MAG: endonuclease VII domain-containing protein, partial [Fibromonadaceae bacterium]|nr:endonuclease VII domain-containing protein [Fibromonadaceae bacterium]